MSKVASKVSTLAAHMERCVALFKECQRASLELAKAIAIGCDAFPTFIDSLYAKCGGHVSRQFLVKLERVGRNQMDLRLALGFRNGVLAERLSFADQRKLLDEGVPVVEIENGTEIVVTRKLSELDPYTASRVIHNDGIADVKTQKQSLNVREEVKTRIATTESPKRNDIIDNMCLQMDIEINVRRKHVTFRRKDVTLTVNQLRMILAELS